MKQQLNTILLIILFMLLFISCSITDNDDKNSSDEDDDSENDITNYNRDSIIGITEFGQKTWIYWIDEEFKILDAKFQDTGNVTASIEKNETESAIIILSTNGNRSNAIDMQDIVGMFLWYNDDHIVYTGSYEDQLSGSFIDAIGMYSLDSGMSWRIEKEESYSRSVKFDRMKNIVVNGMTNYIQPNNSCLLEKYSPQGTLIFQKIFGDVTGVRSTITAMGEDNDYYVICGSLYKFGFDGKLLWEVNRENQFPFMNVDTDGKNIYTLVATYNTTEIHKYSIDGELLWQDAITVPSYMGGSQELVLDSLKQPIVCIHNGIEYEPDDVVCNKYSSDGELIWSNIYSFEKVGDMYLNDLIVDKDDNIYLGIIWTAFNNSTHYKTTAALKIDTAGNEIWHIEQSGEYTDEKTSSPDEPILFFAGGHLMLAPEWQIHYDDDDDTVE